MTSLYRHFDASGSLLYVGISLCPLMRLAAHRTASGWARRIALVKVEWFRLRSSARVAERTAIETERPACNRAMVKMRRAGDVSIPVQFSRSQTAAIDAMRKRTGIKRSALLSLSAGHFLDQVKNGNVDPIDVFREFNKQAA